MFNKSHNCHGRHVARSERRDQHMARRHGFRTSGNTAFDAYKADTLKRLMDEQDNFEAFLERLREAKDKSEFDDFMNDRANVAKEARDDDADIEDAEPVKA